MIGNTLEYTGGDGLPEGHGEHVLVPGLFTH